MTEISKEYGTALFMLACENGKKKEYQEALLKLQTAFNENPDYMKFLSSPVVPVDERLSAIKAAFLQVIPEDVVSYLQLLCQKGRMSCFYDSILEYNKLLDASENVTKAKIISAVALTDKEKKALQNKLEQMQKCAVSMEFCLDETLIGGIIIELDGKVIDGSVRNRLRDIKEVINR